MGSSAQRSPLAIDSSGGRQGRVHCCAGVGAEPPLRAVDRPSHGVTFRVQLHPADCVGHPDAAGPRGLHGYRLDRLTDRHLRQPGQSPTPFERRDVAVEGWAAGTCGGQACDAHVHGEDDELWLRRRWRLGRPTAGRGAARREDRDIVARYRVPGRPPAPRGRAAAARRSQRRRARNRGNHPGVDHPSACASPLPVEHTHVDDPAAASARPAPIEARSSTEMLEAQFGQVADAPLCMTCGTKMRPAGSCYVCEGCGSTSGCS